MPEALDACLSRTAQWDRADLLDAVIGAGATFEDASDEPEFRRCVLASDVGLAYVEKAIALGATPQNCPNSESLIQSRVKSNSKHDDETTAGAMSEHDSVKAIDQAKRRNQPATLAVLEGAAE